MEAQKLAPKCDFCGNDIVLGQVFAKWDIGGRIFVVHGRIQFKQTKRGHPPDKIDCQKGIVERECENT